MTNASQEMACCKRNARVDRANKLYEEGAKYPKGCSDYISTVLDIPWESAESIMGDDPEYIGKDNKYPGLKPGDIVGWKSATSPGGTAHVGIYVDHQDGRFLDVRDLNLAPRRVNGYGASKLYRSKRFPTRSHESLAARLDATRLALETVAGWDFSPCFMLVEKLSDNPSLLAEFSRDPNAVALREVGYEPPPGFHLHYMGERLTLIPPEGDGDASLLSKRGDAPWTRIEIRTGSGTRCLFNCTWCP